MMGDIWEPTKCSRGVPFSRNACESVLRGGLVSFLTTLGLLLDDSFWGDLRLARSMGSSGERQSVGPSGPENIWPGRDTHTSISSSSPI